MKGKRDAEIIFSKSFAEINDERFNRWCIHLICLSGEGRFLYNGKEVRIRRNDASVISHPSLVSRIESSEDLRVEFIAAPFKFLYSLLPANHYGVSGCISLFDDPVIPLSEDDAARLLADIRRIRERIEESEHLFYDELIGSLALTMIYDLFYFHAKLHDGVSTTERTAHIVRRLLSMLESGRCKHFREVAYYAEQLHVSPKYLSDTVKRNTGRSVSYLINRHTIPMITDYLNNSDMSLTQICEEMNFSSLSYFSRYVQRHLGMSPSDYRAAHSPVKKKIE